MADDGINDPVTLTLNGEEVLISTSYTINQSIFRQPGEFELHLGHSGPLTEKIKTTAQKFGGEWGPNTPFELKVGGNLQMTGRTDGFRMSARGGAATELIVFGRDILAPLHDAYIYREVSFNDATYESLVVSVLAEVGLGDVTVFSTGEANRKLKSGVPVKELVKNIQTVDEILASFGDAQTAGATHSVLQSKVGERWMDFLRKQLDRAGLFMWAGGDGSVIVSTPHPELEPTYRIVRRRGQKQNEVNVVHADFLYDTRTSFSFAIVYGRGGGRNKGNVKAKGSAADPTMIDGFKFGAHRGIVIRDKHCQNEGQAGYLSQRKLAEGRRRGYQLVYTLAGHSTPSLDGNRAVWAPDTTVHVVDDEFGLDEVFWIEGVEFRRSPQATTTIRLMRKMDVVFGDPNFEGTTKKFKGNGNLKIQTVNEILKAFWARAGVKRDDLK